MSFSGRRVLPNDTIPTEDMMSRPNLRWEAERGALYTIVLVDNGIERLEGQQYFHWLVSNVPNGYSVASGDEVNRYVPPFGYDFNPDGSLKTTVDGSPLHDILALVYKQQDGRVEMTDERQDTCDPTIATRIGDHAALAEKYNMKLVAGNFFFTTYTKASNTLLCYFTKCTGAPFPVPVPGVNDGPQCQQ